MVYRPMFLLFGGTHIRNPATYLTRQSNRSKNARPGITAHTFLSCHLTKIVLKFNGRLYHVDDPILGKASWCPRVTGSRNAELSGVVKSCTDYYRSSSGLEMCVECPSQNVLGSVMAMILPWTDRYRSKNACRQSCVEAIDIWARSCRDLRVLT